MKASVDVKELRQTLLGLKKAKGERKGPAAHVKIVAETETGAFTLEQTNDRATGSGLYVKADHESAEIERSGAGTIKLMKLDKIVRKLKKRGGRVVFERQPSRGNGDPETRHVTMKHPDSGFVYTNRDNRLRSWPKPDDGAREIEYLGIDGETAEIFDRALPYIATDDARANLTGLCLRPTEVHATDGHRLIVQDHDLGGFWDGEIIPRKAVKAIAYIFDKKARSDAPCYAGRSDNWIGFAKGRWTVRSKQIVGSTFPDPSKVMPKKSGHGFWTEPGEFRQAIELVHICASSKTENVRLEVEPQMVRLSTANPQDSDTAEQPVNCDAIKASEPVKCGYNANYLDEGVQTFEDCDLVRVEVIDTLSPTLLTSKQLDGVTVVVMPMRL